MTPALQGTRREKSPLEGPRGPGERLGRRRVLASEKRSWSGAPGQVCWTLDGVQSHVVLATGPSWSVLPSVSPIRSWPCPAPSTVSDTYRCFTIAWRRGLPICVWVPPRVGHCPQQMSVHLSRADSPSCGSLQGGRPRAQGSATDQMTWCGPGLSARRWRIRGGPVSYKWGPDQPPPTPGWLPPPRPCGPSPPPSPPGTLGSCAG